jgi:hypothetical protein
LLKEIRSRAAKNLTETSRNDFDLFPSRSIKTTNIMKKFILLLACTPFLLASTCEDDQPIACTLEARAGLSVGVKNAVTNEVLADGVTVVAVDGNYAETLEEVFDGNNSSIFIGAWERAGSYTITVTKVGFKTFTSPAIQVTADQCHVIERQVRVNLEPF